ncbi:MAG: glycosyltransferase [Planctomycetales bacterium]|nr:glycosyltransferase [Planctomycetales bacterium]
MDNLDQRAQLMLVVPSLRIGGAETVMIRLANEWASRQHHVELVVCGQDGPLAERIAPAVHVTRLAAPRMAFALHRLLSVIRRRRPAVLLSTVAHTNLACCLLRSWFPPKTKLVIRETNVASRRTNRMSEFAFHAARKQLLRRADHVICQSDAMRRDVGHEFQIPPQSQSVIANPLPRRDIYGHIANPFAEPNCRNLLAAGSLTRKKGFDLLLQAFAKLVQRDRNVRLTLIGEGPQRNQLLGQCEQTKLNGYVHFLPFQADLAPWYCHADLFVLPSRFEGTPNVLLEAMWHGCPVVARSHPGGTSELLQSAGLEERMASNLSDWDEAWFQPLPAGTDQRLASNYAIDTIADQYELLFSALSPAWQSIPQRRVCNSEGQAA